MKCCKDLQIVLTSNDSLSSDINVIELCEEIIALRRRLKNGDSDPVPTGDFTIYMQK